MLVTPVEKGRALGRPPGRVATASSARGDRSSDAASRRTAAPRRVVSPGGVTVAVRARASADSAAAGRTRAPMRRRRRSRAAAAGPAGPSEEPVAWASTSPRPEEPLDPPRAVVAGAGGPTFRRRCRPPSASARRRSPSDPFSPGARCDCRHAGAVSAANFGGLAPRCSLRFEPAAHSRAPRTLAGECGSAFLLGLLGVAVPARRRQRLGVLGGGGVARRDEVFRARRPRAWRGRRSPSQASRECVRRRSHPFADRRSREIAEMATCPSGPHS